MNGRIALVTGASRGIGREIAAVLAAQGATVVAPTRAEMDLASPESIDRYLGALDADIDILVNNAGINDLARVEEISDDIMRRTLQVNLLGPLKLARHVSAGMKSRGYGRIVNLSSVWSLVTKEGRLPYSASKSALNGITRTLAVELAPYNVLVNAVAPGYVNTELTRKNNSPEAIKAFAKQLPIKRLAEPREIAELVAFLCSARNSYLTGQVIAVDGGFLCK